MKCTVKLHSFGNLEDLHLYSIIDFGKHEVMVRSTSFVPKPNNEASVVPKLHDDVSMTRSLGATTLFTYKDDKHVVWLRLVPFVPKLHVGASLA